MKIIHILLYIFFILPLSFAGTCYTSTQCAKQQFCEIRANLCEPCWKCCAYNGAVDYPPPYISYQCAKTCECPQLGSWCSATTNAAHGVFCDYYSGIYRSCVVCTNSECASQCSGYMLYNETLDVTLTTYHRYMLKNTVTQTQAQAKRLPQIAEVAICKSQKGITREGCPCTNSTLLQCPRGSTCMPRNTIALEQDLFDQGLGAYLHMSCTPCPSGTICINPGGIGPPALCPSGSFCPTPILREPCPQGMFCPVGSIEPLPCNYKLLLQKSLYLQLPQQTVANRIIFNLDPYRGNICPQNATAPTTVCPAGYYCPSSAQKMPCPKGHFCRKQSTHPRKCATLVLCNKSHLRAPEFAIILPIFYGLWVVFIGIVLYISKSITFTLSQKSSNSDYMNSQYYIEPIIQSIEFENISARQSKYKTDVHPWLWPNSGSFMPKAMNAVMGSSGCGKSTLIDMIRGRGSTVGHLTGTVCVHDSNMNIYNFDIEQITESKKNRVNLSNLRRLIGFVPQDDVVLGELTVRENLAYSAALKHSASSCRSGRAKLASIVSNTCISLGFQTDMQNRIVGTVENRGISGGQRKRVNIGMELVGLHPILMMDEPTSGLDSSGSQSLLSCCKQLACAGSTIIAVIHQPRCSTFLLFDQVLLLSRFGTVFCGSPCEALCYYRYGLNAYIDPDDNPADAIMDLITHGTDNYSQKQQAALWSDEGTQWLANLRRLCPEFSSIVMAPITPITYSKYKCLAPAPQSNCINVNIFDFLVEKPSMKDIKAFVAEHDVTNDHAFVRAMRNVCETYVLDGKYDNTLTRMSLWTTRIPKQLGYNANSHIGALFLAYKFGRILMKRCHIKSRKDANSIGAALDREILQTAMFYNARAQASNALDHPQVRIVLQNNKSKTRFAFWLITALIMRRKLLSISRSPWIIQLIVPSCAALVVGYIHGANWGPGAFPNNIVMAMACVGVLSMVTHVRTFSLDKVFMRREVHNNIPLSAYYIAYNIVDFIWIAVIPLVFFIPYYYMTFPEAPFIYFYISAALVCWWASGVAYMLSATPLAMQWTILFGVFIAVIFGAFIHGMNPSLSDGRKSPILNMVLSLSYNRWAMESLSLRELYISGTYRDRMPNVVFAIMKRIGMCGQNEDNNQMSKETQLKIILRLVRISNTFEIALNCEPYAFFAQLMLFAQGCAYRICAFVFMWCNYDTFALRIYNKIRTAFQNFW